MCSRSGAFISANAWPNHGIGRRRTGLPCMSESQTQAYLIARDFLRRIQRTSSLILPPEDVAKDRRVRSVSTRSWGRSGDSGNPAGR